MTWPLDMIQFQISAAVPIHSIHTSPRTDEESDEDRGSQRLLWPDTCRRGLLVREEASQQDHLADADYQKDNGFSDGPESNTGI